ncbi:MAG: hypothetical protein SFW36_17990 [Leptolyngbyaceae cyanobacterium bins.59]|nr:hypothetical protein [Leptolyngbyaceae cyanobacterium bins.59]
METSLNASEILGFDLIARDALFLEMARVRGRRDPVSYRTAYDWFQELAIDPGSPAYTAAEALLLLTLSWARGRGLKRIDRTQTIRLTGEFAKWRKVRSSSSSRPKDRRSPSPA